MFQRIYIWFVLLFGITCIPECRSYMKFTHVESCYDPTQTPETYHTITGISVLLCGVLCARDDRCRSISITRDGNTVTCYHNSGRRLLSTGCDNQYRHFNGHHSSCHYRGVLMNGSYGCRCYGGYIGAWCKRLEQDCTEGASTNHYREFTKSSVFHIHPHNTQRVFKVVCKMPQGRTVLLQRNFESAYVNFSRSWKDYKNGFGDFSIDGNLWTGLDMLHHVANNRPHTMKTWARFQEDGAFNRRGYLYSDFKVGSESDGYNFTSTSARFPPNAASMYSADGMSAYLGAGFSIYDVDNDNDSTDNCARIHQSGWWFTTCGGYNPTGQPQPPSVLYKTSDPTQLSWPHTLNYSPSYFSIVVMAKDTDES